MAALSFDPQAYGPAVAALLLPERLPELGPGSPNRPLQPALAALEAPAACHAALWLLHDFLDESHAISQELDSAEGSFWHAIMHRREPDASNSKYWWRRVGAHPVVKRLAYEAPALGYTYTTPSDFVDHCERVRSSHSSDEEVAKRIQLLEWRLLFDYCFRLA